MTWDAKSIEWIFSGIGVLIISGIFYLIRRWVAKSEVATSSQPTITNSVIINQTNSGTSTSTQMPSNELESSLKTAKSKAGLTILFVDDDTKFKVINILKNHGWTNTKIIRDVTSFEQPEVASADILFVDIQGVGKSLHFKDEGLGLVVALKRKYPEKKVVIYSAENGINAFHAAFKSADDRINKDADPYEFIEVVERLSS